MSVFIFLRYFEDCDEHAWLEALVDERRITVKLARESIRDLKDWLIEVADTVVDALDLSGEEETLEEVEEWIIDNFDIGTPRRVILDRAREAWPERGAAVEASGQRGREEPDGAFVPGTGCAP